MKVFYISAAGLLMVACATDQGPPQTVTVQVPVVRPCVSADVPDAPATYADDGLDQVADPVERIQRRAAANQQRKARLAVIEPVVKSCR